MSENLKAFKECLNSNWPCDIIKEKMSKLSKYKLNEAINEEKIFTTFMFYCTEYFEDEVKKFSRSSEKHNTRSNENIFKLSHQIISNKAMYKNNLSCDSIELFYRTFFLLNYLMRMKLMTLHFTKNCLKILLNLNIMKHIYLILVMLF